MKHNCHSTILWVLANCTPSHTHTVLSFIFFPPLTCVQICACVCARFKPSSSRRQVGRAGLCKHCVLPAWLWRGEKERKGREDRKRERGWHRMRGRQTKRENAERERERQTDGWNVTQRRSKGKTDMGEINDWWCSRQAGTLSIIMLSSLQVYQAAVGITVRRGRE